MIGQLFGSQNELKSTGHRNLQFIVEEKGNKLVFELIYFQKPLNDFNCPFVGKCVAINNKRNT
jgi:hypothetical protein